MGWTRNYHAYVFTDRRDGAIFGPCKSDAIDMMHMRTGWYGMIDDSQVQVGQLLANIGDTMGFLYDLGDRFKHELEVFYF